MVYSSRQKSVKDAEVSSYSKKTTSAERTRKYRERLKKKPEKMLELMEKDRKRHERARLCMRKNANDSKAVLETMRQKKREQMRRYRAKKKIEKVKNEQHLAGKNKARKSVRTKQNAAYYMRRQIEQLKKSESSKRTTLWRMRIKLASATSPQQGSQEMPAASQKEISESLGHIDSENCFNSRATEYRATLKLKSVLPSTPKRKARVIEKVLTPKTSSVLKRKGLLKSPVNKMETEIGKTVVRSLKKELETVKTRDISQKEKIRAHKTLKSLVLTAPMSEKSKLRGKLRKYFGFSKGIPYSKIDSNPWWREKIRNKRKDCISESTKCLVREFFLSPEISRQVPLKREVVKIKDSDGKTSMIQKNVMIMTIQEAHGAFKSKFPDIKLGLTSFRKFKPENVKKVSETNRRTCLCTLCSNVSLKLEALKKLGGSKYQLGTLTKQELTAASLCRYESMFPKLDCLQRNCKHCKDAKPGDLLDPLLPYQNESIKWCHWEYINITKKDQIRRVMSCVEKETTVADLKKALEDDMKMYPLHYFRANWQYQQLALNQQHLQKGEVLLTMDFSENYRCSYKDEVQSGFFDQVQVTVHPSMAYYIKDESLVKHAIIGISSDLQHDAHLVKVFEEKALELVSEHAGTEIKTVYEWTDGCAAQYKGRTSFADISLHNVKVHRNFFETSHGKGVCDGIGAVVKNACVRAVISGKAILSNADDVYKYCLNKLAHGPQEKNQSSSTRSEISVWDVINMPQVEHQRPEVDIRVLAGTRTLHAMKNTITPYAVAIRDISCYCNGCYYEKENECENKEWVQPWSNRTLKLVHGKNDQMAKTVRRSSNMDVNAGNKVTEQPLSPPTTWDVGDFAAVKLGGPKSSNIYMAEVLQQDGDLVHVKFMRRCGENLYVWPDRDDDSWEPVQSVLCKLQVPVLANEREQFKFAIKDLLQIKAMFPKRWNYLK